MSDEITLRDTFAAAALTGWLASQQTVVSAAAMASHAYEYADAMLRERAVTNHDAAPAAKAHVDAAGISRQGTGDTTREPVAWGVLPGGDLPLWRCRSREQAQAVRAWLEQQRPGSEPQVVPLVDGRAAPTLTDAEREAIAHAVQFYSQDVSSRWATIADTLRALLARLGGDA